MHSNLKRFGMEGQAADDAAFPRLREQFEHMLLSDMRDSGYIPVLGLGPFWSTEYIEDREQYDFVLSIHGLYVGKEEACQVEGISLEGKKSPRTAPTKLPPSSTNVE